MTRTGGRPSTDDWQVGPLAGDEAAAAAELNRATDSEDWDAAAVARVAALPDAFALAVRSGGRLEGFILARIAADECEVLTLAVAPGSRRRGRGSRLVTAALARAAALGARRAILEVAVDNLAALGLYRRLGFRTEGRRPAYYSRAVGDRADALVLSRTLGRET